MYFDLGDLRPDTPRVPSVISRREGVLLSIITHLVLVIGFLVMPKTWLESRVAPVTPVTSQDPIRYVDIRPQIDKIAPPRPKADASDMDRRSTTVQRPPDPVTPDPYSRGNTPDKIQGAPEPPAAAAASPPAASPANDFARASDAAAAVLPDTSPKATRPAGTTLGDALRDMRRLLQDQSYENPKGGAGEQDPDIQFDSKGVEFGPWLRRFVAQVKSNWFIPETAMFRSGRVVIQFNVHKDGSITDLKIVSPSSVEPFNSAAFNSLKLSNPTLQLPADYPLEKAFFTVTFHYNERGAPRGD